MGRPIYKIANDISAEEIIKKLGLQTDNGRPICPNPYHDKAHNNDSSFSTRDNLATCFSASCHVQSRNGLEYLLNYLEKFERAKFKEIFGKNGFKMKDYQNFYQQEQNVNQRTQKYNSALTIIAKYALEKAHENKQTIEVLENELSDVLSYSSENYTPEVEYSEEKQLLNSFFEKTKRKYKSFTDQLDDSIEDEKLTSSELIEKYSTLGKNELIEKGEFKIVEGYLRGKRFLNIEDIKTADFGLINRYSDYSLDTIFEEIKTEAKTLIEGNESLKTRLETEIKDNIPINTKVNSEKYKNHPDALVLRLIGVESGKCGFTTLSNLPKCYLYFISYFLLIFYIKLTEIY